MAKASTLVKRFCKSLTVSTGQLAGRKIKLAPYQNRFIDGAFAEAINVAVLSVRRGNARCKTCHALLLEYRHFSSILCHAAIL